jgi:capreomycidine synthase
MEIAPALLEGWMRQYYFDTDIDIGSSGVQCFAFSELRQLIGLRAEEMDAITFDDSRTLGGPGLRAAIAARWTNGDAEQVMATHGSSEATYLVMNALLRAGDEVIVLDPCYQQLAAIAEALGCRLRRWPLRPERRFDPDLAELKKLLSPKTRMVVVNFPHNPTGVSLTADEQRELISMVAATGAYLIWDAAFAELTYDRPPLPNPGLVYERAVCLGTLSKAYGLPGLRVGWCLASPDVLARCAHLRDYMTLHLSPLIERIAQKAIENADKLLDIRLRQSRANLEMLSERLGPEPEVIAWTKPEGGVCCFLKLNAVADVETFCHEMAQAHRVLLIPGTCFGHESYVRLGFGGPTAELAEGLKRLLAGLKGSAAGR